MAVGTAAQGGNTSNGDSRGISGVPLIAAIAILLAFGVLVGCLLSQVNHSNEIRWTRFTWLFASVEAIAFGAAGALFGSTIQRQRAENAESAAAANADDAAKGRALAATLQAEELTSPVVSSEPELEAFGASSSDRGAAPSDNASAVVQRHATLARALFPSVDSTAG